MLKKKPAKNRRIFIETLGLILQKMYEHRNEKAKLLKYQVFAGVGNDTVLMINQYLIDIVMLNNMENLIVDNLKKISLSKKMFFEHGSAFKLKKYRDIKCVIDYHEKTIKNLFHRQQRIMWVNRQIAVFKKHRDNMIQSINKSKRLVEQAIKQQLSGDEIATRKATCYGNIYAYNTINISLKLLHKVVE